MCIIDHYPLGNQRTEIEISGGLNISEKLGRDSRCLNPDFLILHLAALPLCYFTPHPFSNNNTIQYGRPSKLDRGAHFPFFCGTATVLTIQLSLQHTRDATPDLM